MNNQKKEGRPVYDFEKYKDIFPKDLSSEIIKLKEEKGVEIVSMIPKEELGEVVSFVDFFVDDYQKLKEKSIFERVVFLGEYFFAQYFKVYFSESKVIHLQCDRVEDLYLSLRYELPEVELDLKNPKEDVERLRCFIQKSKREIL